MSAETPVGCAVDADGRIVFHLPPGPAEGERLLLRLRPEKGQPETTLHVLEPEPAEDGRRRVVLGPQPALASGRWDVYLLREPGSHRERLRPGLRDLRALVDGHLRDRPAPLAVRIPYVTKCGHLAVRAWLRPAHAEVGGIDVTDDAMTVTARLHGADLREGAAVHLRLRGGGGTVRTLPTQAAADGRSFSFTLPCAELAGATGAERGGADGFDSVWDMFVRPAPEAPLIRLARLLDDVADRKEIFVYPPVTVAGAVLRPYYTVDNDLSLEVKSAGRG